MTSQESDFLDRLRLVIADYRYGHLSAEKALMKLDDEIMRRLDMSNKQIEEFERTVQLGKSFARFLQEREGAPEATSDAATDAPRIGETHTGEV